MANDMEVLSIPVPVDVVQELITRAAMAGMSVEQVASLALREWCSQLVECKS